MVSKTKYFLQDKSAYFLHRNTFTEASFWQSLLTGSPSLHQPPGGYRCHGGCCIAHRASM